MKQEEMYATDSRKLYYASFGHPLDLCTFVQKHTIERKYIETITTGVDSRQVIYYWSYVDYFKTQK